MTSHHGRLTQSDPVVESRTTAVAGDITEPKITPVTRSELRSKQKFQQNRFLVFAAGALVTALLLFVAVSMPRKYDTRMRKTVTGGSQVTTAHNDAMSQGRSLLPITDTGPLSAKETPHGLLNEQDLQRTATSPPAQSKPARPSPARQDGTLASIPPLPDPWEPPPYQAKSESDPQSTDPGKGGREGLDKPSLVYARSTSASQVTSRAPNTPVDADLVIDLGLPTGTRLRAHLESAVSTAVRTPVLAAIDYNYQRGGEILIPAGAKAVGHIQQADRSGYVTLQFDSLLMPDDTSVPIQAVATDLSFRALKGKVEGKNTSKNVVLRSLSGIGQVGALLVGRGNLNQPLSEGDILRERVSNNIGQASDEQVSRLALTEHIVVTLPANTPIYVVLERKAQGSNIPAAHSADRRPPSESTTADELRQLLQLQRELRESANNEER
jgi:type F conjugative transfer system protein TrbI